MNGRSFSFGKPGNPLTRVLVGAFIMGAFVLMALLGLTAIAFLVFTVRAWWLRRHPRGRGPNGGPGPPGPAKGIRYIEGEYEVIDADADAERRRSGEGR